jgi:hypothetical protein
MVRSIGDTPGSLEPKRLRLGSSPAPAASSIQESEVARDEHLLIPRRPARLSQQAGLSKSRSGRGASEPHRPGLGVQGCLRGADAWPAAGIQLHFSDAKQSKIREARIEKYAQKILGGKGFRSVRELRPGVWHWQSSHPDWDEEQWWPELVSSCAIELGDDLLLFDPLSVPDESCERATAVVLTAPYHERDARRLGLPVHTPPGDTWQDWVETFGVDPERVRGRESEDLASLRLAALRSGGVGCGGGEGLGGDVVDVPQ